MQINRTCQHCGAAFTAEHAVIKFGRGKHCSTACARAARWSKVTCVCQQCGTTVDLAPSRVAHGRGKHCSRACARLSRLVPPPEGFWDKVDRHGPAPAHLPSLGPCWLWTGARQGPSGYGTMTRDHKTYLAHRVAFGMVNGSIPPRMVVCHKCDNPPCCRPDHLFLGTHADNHADMVAKGRNNVGRGMAKANAKLSDGDVREIRHLHAAGLGTWAIARGFGVSPPTIYAIVTRRSWRHID